MSRLPVFLGGIRSVSSSSVIRMISSLDSGSPGTIAVSPLFERLDGRLAAVQPQPLGPFRLVLTVAGEAVLGQDRPDLAVEVDLPRLGAPGSAAVALAACRPVTTSKTRSVPISMRREKSDTRFPSKITMARD